jgi:hypothetical protein
VLTWFGVASVALMLIAHAIEARAPLFVLLFAGACAASSVYGFLVGAWPFGASKPCGRAWRCDAGTCERVRLHPDGRRRRRLPAT